MSDEIDYTRIERPNPPEPTKADECRDFFTLADKSRICKLSKDTPHSFCENMVKYGECPKGIKE